MGLSAFVDAVRQYFLPLILINLPFLSHPEITGPQERRRKKAWWNFHHLCLASQMSQGLTGAAAFAGGTITDTSITLSSPRTSAGFLPP